MGRHNRPPRGRVHAWIRRRPVWQLRVAGTLIALAVIGAAVLIRQHTR